MPRAKTDHGPEEDAPRAEDVDAEGDAPTEPEPETGPLVERILVQPGLYHVVEAAPDGTRRHLRTESVSLPLPEPAPQED